MESVAQAGSFMRILVLGIAVWLLGLLTLGLTSAETKPIHRKTGSAMITITILYNNVSHNPALQTAWGLACLIEYAGKTVLFDTGGDGRILIANMKALNKDPQDVDIVVLSHIHADHVGGLWKFLEKNNKVDIYLPDSFPASFKDRAAMVGARVSAVRTPLEIDANLYSTGEMGIGIKEQALILCTPKGLVVVTGCAHPGIVNITKQAVGLCKNQVYLILGGFHLMAYSEVQVRQMIAALKDLGVQKVGPSHCTGDRPIQMFKQAWKDNFVDLGCGAVFTVEKAS